MRPVRIVQTRARHPCIQCLVVSVLCLVSPCCRRPSCHSCHWSPRPVALSIDVVNTATSLLLRMPYQSLLFTPPSSASSASRHRPTHTQARGVKRYHSLPHTASAMGQSRDCSKGSTLRPSSSTTTLAATLLALAALAYLAPSASAHTLLQARQYPADAPSKDGTRGRVHEGMSDCH